MPSDAGKGPEWRKGTNWKAWYNSPTWEFLEKNKKKKEQPKNKPKDKK